MTIPSFPKTRPMELSDKTLFDLLFASLQPRISEFTFAGLYLFRRAHVYRISRLGESIIVSGCGYDRSPCALPPLGGDAVAALNVLAHAGITIYGADETLATRLADDKHWHIVEDRDSFDYLYLREELTTLPGSRFHKKKNRINYFTNRHAYEVEAYTDRHLKGCLDLLDIWGRVASGEANKSLALEISATSEALKLAGALGLEGVVIMVDGTVAAFALGERLNRETAVCHFEKANPFMEGLSQLVNREFARLLFNDSTFLNREQDLGEPGLRNAKLSYHPIELVKKYRVSTFRS